MKKLFSGIFNFKLPSKKEINLAFSAFSKKEWVAFSVLGIIFFISFLSLLNILNKSFTVEIPARGGTVTEGIVGTPRFVNPVLAFSDIDRDLVTLIYSGLLRKNSEGLLISDLAENYEASEDGLSYVFTLKDKIYFHDGEPVTADDVVFTIKEAKNPVLKISNGLNWEGVEVEKMDDRTVRFTLHRPDASFLESTTMGIMPQHLWEDFPIELNDMNINPVGSGPFQIEKTEKGPQGIVTAYELSQFKKFALGRPYINELYLRFYANEDDLIKALKENKIDQAGQISPKTADELREEEYNIHSYILPRVFGLFFNQSENQIFTDKNVISAIDVALDKKRIVEEVLYGYGTTIDGPVPESMRSEIKAENKTLTRDERIKAAEELLIKNGWERNDEGIMERSSKVNSKTVTIPLTFSISTSNSEDLVKAANIIKEELGLIGMQVEIKTFELGDLNQSVIRPRKYDALLFGEIINRQSDLFAFWHSSQRKDPGLNVAMYTNVKVDKLLEDALVTLDREKREEKYSQFEEEVKKEKPAVFLYSPSLIYITKKGLEGLSSNNIISAKDRFLDSYLWHTESEDVWKIFSPNR